MNQQSFRTRRADPEQPQCRRPGCSRYVRPRNGRQYTECSQECRLLTQAWEDSQNLASALGPSNLTDRYMTGVRKLMAQWDDVSRTRAEIRREANSVGIQGEAWAALLRGTYRQGTG